MPTNEQSSEVQPQERLPADARTEGKRAIPIKVRIIGTPSSADLDKLTASVARAVGKQLRAAQRATPEHSPAVAKPIVGFGIPAGAVDLDDSAAEQGIRQRLARVDKDLATGIGVRSPAMLAELEAEKRSLLTSLAVTLEARLKDNRKQQTAEIGVRSPDFLAELADKERRIVGELAVVRLLAQYASGPTQAVASSPSHDLPINWFGGANQRGLGGESLVGQRYYPDATEMPKDFGGIDFIEGGKRTPLTGIQKVGGQKLPLSQDSFRVEGGRVIQVKTLENSTPGYQVPGAIKRELQKGIDKLVATDDRGVSRSRIQGKEVRRVEYVGNPDERILHVELAREPTAAQSAELEQEVRVICELNKIKFTYNWPKSPSVPKPVPKPWMGTAKGTALGLGGLALGKAGEIGRENRREDQQNQQGYAPVGSAAYAVEPWYIRLGSFFRFDGFETNVQAPEAADIPVWRQHIRRTTEAKKIGDSLSFAWQTANRSPAFSRTLDVFVTYRKGPDGRWSVESTTDAPQGFRPPDINRIIDVDVSDGAVESMLSFEGPTA
ncbi:hypothetical protein [Nocardia altamirensis]|uniref:hypothetical protein n=1 Tax=Nocardia altamirensis TaxID=472158 RepID=UPI00083FDE34|nr:hypothetical protein [Nocardia altamirensis]